MQAGDLRQFVTIQTRTKTSDGHDGYTESWGDVRVRIPAQIVPLQGRDLINARQIDPRASHAVTLRYWKRYGDELTGGRARLLWHDGDIGDRALEIVEPPRELETRTSLVMVCREAA